jgi:hypothetical protein
VELGLRRHVDREHRVRVRTAEHAARGPRRCPAAPAAGRLALKLTDQDRERMAGDLLLDEPPQVGL